MASLLNTERPPVFCPGCSHEAVVRALDQAFQELGLRGEEIALVSDIGCSGLFDTFFHTHALHGLHGRALTYAAGLKLARPELTVVATMGDGGLGIGGAHVLAACRRNLDLTLLILNNFNFGMTGGQFSATTPESSRLGSSFLNSLERPMDPGRVVEAAGAPFVARSSATSRALPELLARAIGFTGFSAVDIRGVCPGRFSKQNRLTPKMIEEELAALPPLNGPIEANERPEYGSSYRRKASECPEVSLPPAIEPAFASPQPVRQEVLLLGAAGQRVVTAGELLCLAGMSAGLQATLKSDYPITVLRGHSISEVILSPEVIEYTGLLEPSVVLALAEDGVARRPSVFERLGPEAVVLRAAGIDMPKTRAGVVDLDLPGLGLKRVDWALGCLAALAGMERAIHRDMLLSALEKRFSAEIASESRRTVEQVLTARPWAEASPDGSP